MAQYFLNTTVIYIRTLCTPRAVGHSTSVLRHPAQNLLMDRSYAFAFELWTC